VEVGPEDRQGGFRLHCEKRFVVIDGRVVDEYVEWTEVTLGERDRRGRGRRIAHVTGHVRDSFEAESLDGLGASARITGEDHDAGSALPELPRDLESDARAATGYERDLSVE
jgi:hypothetical protein